MAGVEGWARVKADGATGGTNSTGIGDEVFAMPAGMTIRYDRPGDALTDLITGYHVYGARGVAAVEQTDWFLPATVNVRIAFDAGPIAVSIGRRTFDPLPRASLFGPTSTALKAVTHGGVMIGFGVSALGWSRLFRQSAADFRNLIVPLDVATGSDFADELVAALRAVESEEQFAPLLDRLLAAQLGPPHPDEPLIRALTVLISRDGSPDIGMAADELGITTHALRRLSVRYFGFTPKTLLMRARFLRSFLRIFRVDGGTDYSVIDPSYFDVPHFLRDSSTFLGMTPRRFMALSTPFLDASLRARAAVLGAPTQALHRIAE